MYTSRELFKRRGELAKELQELLEAEGLEVNVHNYGDSFTVGALSVKIDTRKQKKAYSEGLVIKWEYGTYPTTKKWVWCEGHGTMTKLPSTAVERTKELMVVADEDRKARNKRSEERAKREAEARARKKDSTQVVVRLRKELELPEVSSSYLEGLIHYNGATVRDTDKDPTKVEFEFKGVVTPEKAQKLLAILGS